MYNRLSCITFEHLDIILWHDQTHHSTYRLFNSLLTYKNILFHKVSSKHKKILNQNALRMKKNVFINTFFLAENIDIILRQCQILQM